MVDTKWDDQIGRAILGSASRRPLHAKSPEGAVRSIENRLGVRGPQAAAKLGIPERTWRRWARGEVKTIPARLGKAFRRAQLSQKREAKLRASGAGKSSGGRFGLQLTDAEIQISDQDVEQTCNVGMVLIDDHGRNAVAELIDAYLSDTPGAMTSTMESILDDYGSAFGVTGADFGSLGDIHT